MSVPVFEQVTAGLYRLSTLAESGLEQYWAGYLASPDNDLGASASLAQTWADQGGAYLFLGSAPADPAAFVSDLRALWPRLSPKGWLRLLWLANPADPASQWQTHGIDALPASAGDPAGIWRVVRDSAFNLGGYAVTVHGATRFSASSDSLLFAASGLAFTAPGGIYPPIETQCPLPLAGAQLGCLTFGIRASHGGSEEADDMQRLGVMLRYGEADADSRVGEVSIIDMPLFRQLDATPFDLALAFDPLNPELPQRSALVFATAEGQAPTLGFAQLSNTGHATQATPRAGSGVLPGARLNFGRTPLFDAPDAASASLVWHLAPDGLFDLGTPRQARSSDGNTRLILGVSGTETVVLPQDGASLLLFQANGAAYLPPADEKTNSATLSDLGTTAWATVLSDGGSGRSYGAQPPRAPLFNAAQVPVAGFLAYLNMNAATLPTLQASQQSVPTVWPMGVYGRIAASAIDQAAHLEDAALAPTRRTLIGLPPQQAPRSAPTGRLRLGTQANAADTPPLGVTPSGLIAVLDPAQSAWAGMLFANMPQSSTGQLILTEVKPPFQAALQSNQMFMVVADVDTFMDEGSSVAYQLTAANAVSRLLAAGVPAAQAQAINTALKALGYPEFPNETAFDAAVSASAGDYLAEAESAAGLLRADIEGWTFQLSPRAWRKDALTPTLMLFKYCGRAITDLATDTSAWCWPDVAKAPDGSLAPTLAALHAVILKARLAALDPNTDDGNPLALFYHEVLDNPRWNGVLFLNAPIDFQDMPSALRFMAAGVDRTRFYAHHIGFSLTPYTPHDGIIELGQTAAFGLIDYNDPDDLVASTTIPFGYKTLSMRVRFDNARVVDFSAQAELMVNRLFASWLAKVDRARGNNLILTGSYQRIGGQPSYSFSLLGDNVFQSNGAALANIDIRDCRMETAAAPVDGLLTANFVLSGRLGFVEIPEFDLFGYGPGDVVNGYLSFQGLVVAMSFAMENPSEQRFTSGEAGVNFDTGPGASLARPASLIENFPLRLDGLVAAPDLAPAGQPPQGATPESLGFTSIGAPLDQQPLAAPWFGLSMALDMGTLGALSGAIGLKITLLAAWGPEPVAGDPPVYLGIKLGMSNALNGSLPLQGVLKLGFRNFLFETWRDSDNRLNYLLRMRRFALSVLAWSFPPGNADLMLFGAPGSPKTSLGWYAAYLKDEDKKKQQQALLAAPAPRQVARRTPDGRRLARSGRRTPPVI